MYLHFKCLCFYSSVFEVVHKWRPVWGGGGEGEESVCLTASCKRKFCDKERAEGEIKNSFFVDDPFWKSIFLKKINYVNFNFHVDSALWEKLFSTWNLILNWLFFTQFWTQICSILFRINWWKEFICVEYKNWKKLFSQNIPLEFIRVITKFFNGQI